MGCIRCGKKTTDKNVFCQECLQSMEQYPVKPGTPIQIPVHPVPQEPGRVPRKKKEIPLDEQLSFFKKLALRLAIAVLALLLSLGLSLAALFQLLFAPPAPAEEAPVKSRNYTTSSDLDN